MEIGIITVIVFSVMLIFTVVSDLYYTEKVYLTSKNEMIDRDLDTVCSSLEDEPNLEWGMVSLYIPMELRKRRMRKMKCSG